MTTVSEGQVTVLKKRISAPCIVNERKIELDEVITEEVPIYERIRDTRTPATVSVRRDCPPGFLFVKSDVKINSTIGNVSGPYVEFIRGNSHFLDIQTIKKEYHKASEVVSGQTASIDVFGKIKAQADEWKTRLRQEESELEEYFRSTTSTHDACLIRGSASCIYNRLGVCKSGAKLDATVTLYMRRVGTAEDLRAHLETLLRDWGRRLEAARTEGRVALQASNGQYVCAEGGGGRELVANRARIGAWETFTCIDRTTA